jgi:hypothetical protein
MSDDDDKIVDFQAARVRGVPASGKPPLDAKGLAEALMIDAQYNVGRQLTSAELREMAKAVLALADQREIIEGALK